ncbi:MAG: GTPase/DUF3482 domain-containing protein [Desulforhopalus sp.]
MIPEFAILGHPNEGKSSVLSTLAEDDSVRISPTPGETTQCRTFPVIIDNRELLRFTDTPGFQNPGRVLSEFKKRSTESSDPLGDFRKYAENIPELADDRELLAPVERGAGIIYVVDGSRPVRNVDRAEMEILRLTGKPRMAVINCKVDAENYLDEWKNEFRKNFNSYRLFNAHRATYAERILLLDALKSIDQDWQPVLSKVVEAFKKDWARRNNATADIITGLLKDSLTLQLTRNSSPQSDQEQQRSKLFQDYCKNLGRKEKIAHQRIRDLFKHNIFEYELPPHSILHEELFDERTWQLLGLTQKQIIIAGAMGGAAIGAGLDVAALGHGLGMFTAVGGVAGALGALFGGESFSDKARVMGLPLGGRQIQIGPARSINLLFILLNRSLLYYQHTINWAHGRRDYQGKEPGERTGKTSQGITSDWSTTKLKICHDFFKALQEEKSRNNNKAEEPMRKLILNTLMEISESD